MLRTLPIPSLQPFLLCLIATVAVVPLMPAWGAAVHGFELATDFAIALSLSLGLPREPAARAHLPGRSSGHGRL